VVDLGDSGWPAEVRRLTGKHGVDLVVEHLGGTVLEQCFPLPGAWRHDCDLRRDDREGGFAQPLAVLRQTAAFDRKLRSKPVGLGESAGGDGGRLVAAGDRHVCCRSSEAEEGFHRLRERKVLGKIVCVPERVTRIWRAGYTRPILNGWQRITRSSVAGG
jgi:hypothetical protein